MINPAFNQFNQSSGPVSGSLSGRSTSPPSSVRVQLSEEVLDSSLHLLVPSATVTQIWLVLEQSELVTQVSLQPTVGVGVGVEAAEHDVEVKLLTNLQVFVSS